MSKLSTYTTQVTNYKTREFIDSADLHAQSVNAALPVADRWASEVLPGIQWGNYFRIPQNGVWCRRSVCRTYQQTLLEKSEVQYVSNPD